MRLILQKQNNKPMDSSTLNTMTTKEVQVEIRNVYGNELIYPVNETAKLLTALTGKKTLSSWDIKNIKALGYTVTAITNQTTQL